MGPSPCGSLKTRPNAPWKAKPLGAEIRQAEKYRKGWEWMNTVGVPIKCVDTSGSLPEQGVSTKPPKRAWPLSPFARVLVMQDSMALHLGNAILGR